VWTGCSAGASPSGPLIFSTVVIYSNQESEIYQYSTLEQAQCSHVRLVELAKVDTTPIPGFDVTIDKKTQDDRWEAIIMESSDKNDTTKS